MKKYFLGLLLISGFATTAAQAGDIAEDSYISGGYFHQVVKGKLAGAAYPSDARKLDTFDIRYGFFLLPILSVEGHFGTSINSYGDGFTPSRAKNDYYGAAYGRINWPFYKRNMNFYAMGGMVTSNYTAYNGSTDVSMTETVTGVSAAVGFQVFSGGNTGISVEWYRFLYAPEFRSNGYMISIVQGFSLWDFLFDG